MPKISKTYLCWLLILILCCSLFLFGCKDSVVSAKNPWNTDFKVNNINYKITAKLDDKEHKLYGTEYLSFKNIYSTELKELVFNIFADSYASEDTKPEMFVRINKYFTSIDPNKRASQFLGYMDISSIKTSEDKNLSFSKKDQVLKVSLDKPLKPGESIEIKLDFITKFPEQIQRLSYYNNLYCGVFWYPILAVYDAKENKWNEVKYSKTFETDYYEASNYEIDLEVPKDFTVEIAGVTTEKIEKDKKSVHSLAENTREVVFFASPKFKKLSKEKDGLTVNLVYFDEGEKKDTLASKYVDMAFKALDFFSEKFGKYPYKDFDISETYIQGLAIEYTGAIQMYQLSSIAPMMHTDMDWVLVHEIAHQWFHGIIGNNSEMESFLDEGFADFSRYYFMDKYYGEYMSFDTLLQNRSAPITLPINSSNEEAQNNCSRLYYEKGALALYDLYKKVGEEKFDQLMKEYFNEYKFKNATIEGFLSMVEKVCGKEIRNYMDEALNKPNYDIH